MYLPDSAILISVSCTCLDSSLQARAASTVAQSSVHVPLTLTHTQLVSESVQSVSSPTVQTGTCKKVVLSMRQIWFTHTCSSVFFLQVRIFSFRVSSSSFQILLSPFLWLFVLLLSFFSAHWLPSFAVLQAFVVLCLCYPSAW